jgi:hypothetical protein
MINTEHSSTQAHNPTAATKTIQMAQGGPSSAMVNWTHPTFRFYSAPSPGCLQEVVRLRAFRSSWTFSRALDARNTSSEISSASYLQLYSSFLALEAEDPPLRSDICDDGIGLRVARKCYLCFEETTNICKLNS